MSIDLIPPFLKSHYEVLEWKHACAILKNDFPQEWSDIIEVLTNFNLKRSWIIKGGGRKSEIAKSIDNELFKKGWIEKEFDTRILVDEKETFSPTHKVDCYKNKVAIEIEWNNKDPFFDRDLNNFRLLFDLRVISVGIIITRSDELQELFEEVGRGASYGASTTHMSKLLPKIEGGSGGGCPLLIFGITKKLYLENE